MKQLKEIRPRRLPYSKVLKDDQQVQLELEQDTAVNLYLFKKDVEDFEEESLPDDLLLVEETPQNSRRGSKDKIQTEFREQK